MRKMAVILALMFIASCARVPIPIEQGYPISYQEKMQASEHWRVSAEDIAKQVKLVICPDVIVTTTGCGPNLSQEQTSTYISLRPVQTTQTTCQIKDEIFVSDADQTTFGMAMRTFLITELQKQEMVPSENPKSPYILRWDVQEVYHYAAREGKYTPHSEIIISYSLISAGGGGSKYFAQVYYVNDVDISQYGYKVRTSPPPPPPPSLHTTTYTVTNR